MMLFFDFDGTIANSVEVALEIIAELAPEYNLPAFSRAELLDLKNKSLPELLSLSGISIFQIPGIIIKGREKFHQKKEGVKIYPEIKRVLQTLHEAGYEMHILTSNAKKNVEYFLEVHDLPFFSEIHTPNALLGKSKIIRKVLKKKAFSSKNIWMIGDEVRDVEAGKEAGIFSLAVNWGYNSEALLLAANPDILVETPEKMLEVLLAAKENHAF